MRPNRAFRQADEATNLAFAAERGFGMLAVALPGGGAPALSHLPFVIDAQARRVAFHLMRAGPIAPHLADAPDGLPAVLAVTGPDGYISPDWYGLADQVPTWNYVAVHLTGRLRLEDHPPALEAQLAALSARFEAPLAPKPPWTMDKLDSRTAERMKRPIVAAALAIERIAGTWKLSQNKPDAAREAAADAVEAAGRAELARLMRTPPARPRWPQQPCTRRCAQ